MRPAVDDTELVLVVEQARAGANAAWETLIERFGGLVAAIARRCRLNDADVAEVCQTTWLRLVENLDRIEQPERIGAWLATTSRRESLRIATRQTAVSATDVVYLMADEERVPSRCRASQGGAGAYGSDGRRAAVAALSAPPWRTDER